MTVLKEGRSITVPIIFTREGTDSHNNRTNVFLETSITFKCWSEEGYEENSLKLIRGHTGRFVRVAKGKPLIPETVLRVYMTIPNEEGSSSQEIDGFLSTKYDGLTISTSKTETVLTTEEAITKINSGTCMFLTEALQKRPFDV